MLAGDADGPADALRVAHDVVAADDGGAGVGPEQRGQDAHERRLAGAVGTEQRVDGAGGDGEVDAVEHAPAAEGLAEAVDADRRGWVAVCCHGSSIPATTENCLRHKLLCTI